MSIRVGRALVFGIGGVFGLVWGLPSFADVVRLHSGAELRGRIVSPAKGRAIPKVDPAGPPADPVVIETLFGGSVTIPAADVAFLSRRPLDLEQYEVRARHVTNSVDGQWELAEWCRQEHLAEQREFHARRVLDLDPHHEAAHRALGHVWKEGHWVDYDVYMTERGFVKHKGRWITQPEYELIAKTAAEIEREESWFPKIKLWTGWVTGNHADRAQQGMQAFRELQDGDAAPAILKLMGKHASGDVRLLGVNVLRKAPGAKAATGLATFVLADPEPEIRRIALEGIGLDEFATVRPLFTLKLKSADNVEVNRAAVGLRRVGTPDSVAPLINALITTHRYNVRVRGGTGTGYSFGGDGSFGAPGVALPPQIEAGLRTGQYPNGVIVIPPPDASNMLSKWVVVQQDQQNPEVLETLRQLTGADFGYDERSWQLWWSAQQHVGGLEKS